MAGKLTVLELYCGIGGCAAALGDRAEVVAAVDISRKALEVYARNFRHPTVARTLESIPAGVWRGWPADLWWLSPPCQPYTHRGRRRDLDDPRAASWLAVLERLSQFLPRFVAVENVLGFAGSNAHRRLREVLAVGGYAVHECQLCPTELGVPSRRPRFYLVASRSGKLPLRQACETASQTGDPAAGRRFLAADRHLQPEFSVRQILDRQVHPACRVPPELRAKYSGAFHVVDAQDDCAECSCFTSGYGRSFVRSGSYLRTEDGLRRFSPAEILRLLCFPDSFSLPPALAARHAWPLVGNSLSVRAVQSVLEPVFGQWQG